MTIDPNLVKAATESKVVEKVYDDLFSQPIKEVSKIVAVLQKNRLSILSQSKVWSNAWRNINQWILNGAIFMVK